jgi:hypothetical protein
MKVLSISLVLVLMSAAAVCAGQAPPQAPPQAQAEKAFQGALVKIDIDTKMLTVRGADNKDWQFIYSDATRVTGPEKTVQGLAAKPGAKLRVMYKVEQGKNHATHIEMTQ